MRRRRSPVPRYETQSGDLARESYLARVFRPIPVKPSHQSTIEHRFSTHLERKDAEGVQGPHDFHVLEREAENEIARRLPGLPGQDGRADGTDGALRNRRGSADAGSSLLSFLPPLSEFRKRATRRRPTLRRTLRSGRQAVGQAVIRIVHPRAHSPFILPAPPSTPSSPRPPRRLPVRPPTRRTRRSCLPPSRHAEAPGSRP